MESGDLGYGEFIPEFERLVAQRVGRRYGAAVSSGTAALHLALLAAGVGPGDLVIVPTLTFVATANAVRYCGAEPLFVDVDPQTGCLNPLLAQSVAASTCCQSDPRIKAVVPVGLLGQPLELGGLPEALAERGIALVEDAAQALGATGAGRQGLASCFSFNANKLVTAAGGGMVVTDDEEVDWTVRHLADQARERDYPAEYRHDALGYNYRLSNVQAAVGVAQMEKLEEHLARKRAIHRQYREGLAEVLGVSLWPADHDGSSHWLSAVQVAAKGALLQHLRGRGIEALSLYYPLHQLPDYQEHPPRYVGGEAAEDLWATTALLPSGCGLSEAQVEEVIVEVCRWAGQR